MPSNKDAQYWQNFLSAWKNYTSAKHDLLMDTPALIEFVHQGMIDPNQRHAAFDIACYMNVEQLQQLLPTLLAHAAYRMSTTANTARELILKLPHDWLLENIEANAEKLLSANDFYDYQGLFWLYREIDTALTKRLIERALASSNPEVREAGADFAEALASD